MVKLHVKFGPDSSIEVEAMNVDELAVVVNRTIKKFFARTDLSDVKEDF